MTVNHEWQKFAEEMGIDHTDKKMYARWYRKHSKGQENTWLTKTYGRMKRDMKAKFGKDLPFSKGDFLTWAKRHNLDTLLGEYEKRGFDKYFNPSVDRVDDYVGYTFDNMKLITWAENNAKGRIGIKNKRQCAEMAKKVWSKKVIQKDLKGNKVNEFESTHDANRKTGIDSSLIARACRQNKISKGYRWFYE